eukprot:2159112-Prymnesium_polylepis.1
MPLLYHEGVLVDVCGAAVAAQCIDMDTKCCSAQLLDFTLLSTVSFFASDSAMVIYGECIDRLGPRMTFLIASGVAGLGLFLIGLNASLQADWLWFAAFLLLGAGGPGVFMGCLIFAEVFPDHRALATSVAASMWDTSSVVFLLFHALYFSLGWSFATIAYAWLALSMGLSAATFALLPSWRSLRRMRTAPLPHAGSMAGDSTDPLLDGQLYNPRITPTRLVVDPVANRSRQSSSSSLIGAFGFATPPPLLGGCSGARVTPTSLAAAEPDL